MKRRNKWMVYMMVFCMVFSIFGKTSSLFGAEAESITIRTAEDLIDLAQKCNLDTWSTGKKVVLKKNIDMSGSAFGGIPIFAGEFEGNGYIISGVNIQGKGAAQGFFRYIEEGGIVKNLTIKGNVTTSGTKKALGGIVGQNRGTIKSCTFMGSVNGESYIGGAVGINEASGKVIEVITQGVVTGTHYVGGVVGENLGTILISQNKSEVNNAASEIEVNLESIESMDTKKLNSSENITSNTDVGGIAGFSTGIIQGCENYGIIGYQHIGYNVGGVVGRQSGYINDCSNYGQVFGRKDVGGIAGQMEPYVTLQFSKGKLGDLQDELNKLQRLMNKAIDDAGGYSDEISAKLNNTRSYIDTAIVSTNSLARQTENIYNEAIDSINDLSARTSSMLQEIVPVLNEAAAMGENISIAVNQLREATNALSITSDEGKKALERVDDTLDDLESNGKDYRKALANILKATEKLNSSIGDKGDIADALDQASIGFNELAHSLKEMGESFEAFQKALVSLEVWIENDENWKMLIEGMGEVGTALKEVGEATTAVVKAIQDILTALDNGDMKSALDNLELAALAFTSAMDHLEKALSAVDKDDMADSNITVIVAELNSAAKDVEEGMNDINGALQDLKRATSREEVKAAVTKLQTGLGELTTALEKVSDACSKINTALDGMIANEDSEEIANSKQQAKEGLKRMEVALKGISSSVSKLEDATNKISDQINLSDVADAGDALQLAVKELLTATKNTDTVLSDMKHMFSSVTDTVIAADKVTEKIKEALSTCHDISLQGIDMAENMYRILSDFTSNPTISLPNLDSKYMQNADELNQSLGDISTSLGTLNDVMLENNSMMLDDLASISNQVYVVLNLLIDATLADDTEETLSEYHEDISDQDTDNSTQGKLLKCLNEGEVQGDVNVGGITGSMAIEYDFDPEDDVTKVGDKSLKFQYLTRAVIRECVNKGSITSKKNYTGGIVGRMDLGTIIGAIGYGKITSTAGDYIGGIAGASYSHIQDSFAMCVLSGGKNVGGITGYGTKLTRNYAMVEVQAYLECVGAIAGDVENINEQMNNYFVDRGIAGIDSISYAGKSAPMAYAEFIEVPNLPKAFTSLGLTFVANGKTVATVPFKFGESIDKAQLPEIPQQTGYYGAWPDFDYTALTFSATLEAVYTPLTTVVESTASEAGRALALIEGSFGADVVLCVTQAAVAMPKDASKNAKIWEVTLSQVDTSLEQADAIYELRLLVGEKGKNNIYVLQENGIWKKVSAKQNGSYAIVKMAGSSGVYCIDKQSFWKEIVTLIGGVLIIAFGITIGFKKKNNKKANQSQSQSV